MWAAIRIRDIFHQPLWNAVGDLQIASIHVFPNSLKRNCAGDPLFGNDDAVTRQDGEDYLAQVGRAVKGNRPGEGSFDAARLGFGGARDRVMIVGRIERDEFDPAWVVGRDSAVAMEFGSHNGYSGDRKSTRLNSSHIQKSRMPSSA